MPDAVPTVREPTPEEKNKWSAEADAAKALAVKHQAEALLFAEQQGLAAEERRYRAIHADASVLTLEREKRKEKAELAQDRYHNTYLFQGGVAQASVEACIKQLNEWHREDPEGKWEIIFDSPGGSVFAGFRLFDYIQAMRKNGHYVTTTAVGMAASMGSILLQAGDHRRMTANSFVLLHEISTSAGGKVGDIEDTMELMKKLEKRSLIIFSKRSGMTPAKIKNMQRRKDLWLSSDECLKLKLVDEVID